VAPTDPASGDVTTPAAARRFVRAALESVEADPVVIETAQLLTDTAWSDTPGLGAARLTPSLTRRLVSSAPC
jgi:hypothetical protein